MKKTNLFKKMTSLFLAIMMLMSVVPMMASAEVSDGKFWQTISVINMDGIAKTEDTPANGSVKGSWAGTQTVTGTSGERTLYLNALSYYYYDNGTAVQTMPKTAYSLGKWTHIGGTLSDAQTVNKPAEIGNTLFNLDRQYNSNTIKTGSPDSSILLTNIYDEADVNVGDTIRVTAYVWTDKIKDISSGSAVDTDATDTTFSMWVSERKDIGDGTVDYNKYQFESALENEVVTTTVKSGQWNEVSLQYVITEDNKTISNVQMNSDNKTHNVTYYPQTLQLGAVKVEKLSEANGKYTIEDGGEFTVIDTMNFDGLSTKMHGATSTNTGRDTNYVDADTETVAADEYEYYGWEYTNSKTLEDGRVQYVRALPGESTVQNDNGVGGQRMGEILVPGEYANDDRYGAALEDTVPAIAGTNSFLLSKRSSKHGKIPKPSASFRAYNIFDEDDVQVGDTVRITAWVYTSNILQWVNGTRVDPTEAAPIDQTSPIDIRMWLSETQIDDTDCVNYIYTAPKTDGTEQILTTVVPRTWTPISFTYKVTEENKNISSIRLDGGADVEGQRYADWTFISAIQVEKLAPVETEVAGRISGKVAAAPATVEDGADYRVLVGAYKKVGDVYMMLGCHILPYEADNSYDFTINDADGTTDVFAYLWNMNDLEPQIIPIDCTYVAQ